MTRLQFRPPKVNINAKYGGFWKQIVMIVIGTTISLVLTILAAQLMESRQRTKDRRLSAMMVMSNIEVFARLLDGYSTYLATADSTATWLLSKPIEELELMPEGELNSLIDQASSLPFLSYDKSAEYIFSNNIETWKNMGNVTFINHVGQCFSSMNQVEEYWNNRVTDLNETILDIKDHPGKYEGNTIPIKILRSDKARRSLKGIHYLRGYLSYVAATMRYKNRQNMIAIGIEEQEVMEYTNDLELKVENAEEEPDASEYYTAPLNPDSLISFKELDESLEKAKLLNQ